MFCEKCGSKIPTGSSFCSECGNKVANVTTPTTTTNSATSFGWGILGFFLPIVGLILFLVWLKEKPSDSKAAGIGALIRTIINVLAIILYVIIIVFVFSNELY